MYSGVETDIPHQCECRFLESTDLTSETNLRASRMGRRLSRAVSEGSLNHDLIGMALSEEGNNILKLI